jgi:hypothetical protein
VSVSPRGARRLPPTRHNFARRALVHKSSSHEGADLEPADACVVRLEERLATAPDARLRAGASGLPASSIQRLREQCQAGHAAFCQRGLRCHRHCYRFLDGIHMSVRLGEDDRLWLLVQIGVREDGENEPLAVEHGFATPKLRTRGPKARARRRPRLAMAYKRLDAASRRSRRFNTTSSSPILLAALKFKDGVRVTDDENHHDEMTHEQVAACVLSRHVPQNICGDCSAARPANPLLPP